MRTKRTVRSLRVGLIMVLLGVALAGCDDNKKVKDCASKCEKAAEACVQKKEQACEDRGKKCASYCEQHAGEFHF